MRALTLFISGIVVLCAAACGGDSKKSMPTACELPTGTGTEHSGTISADETWTTEAGPHFVRGNLIIAEGATVKIEACNAVHLEKDVEVRGRLEAIGTEDAIIDIAPSEADVNQGSITVTKGFADLQYVVMHRPSVGDSFAYAGINVWGNEEPPVVEHARLRTVVIEDSDNYGLSLERGGTLTADSADITIRGSAAAPIIIADTAASVNGLPLGDYGDNTVKAIVVHPAWRMEEDTTFRNYGIPYQIGLPDATKVTFDVGGDMPATWTIEAGVEIQVPPESVILIDDLRGTTGTVAGTLIAKGTAEDPIVFTATGDAPEAGHWRGIVFDSPLSSDTAMEHIEVRYAGGPSGANSFHCRPGSNAGYSEDEDSAIAFFDEPSASMLKNAVIADSAADGIDLAYNGSPVDFAGITYENIARCSITLPRDENGACPDPVPACN